MIVKSSLPVSVHIKMHHECISISCSSLHILSFAIHPVWLSSYELDSIYMLDIRNWQREVYRLVHAHRKCFLSLCVHVCDHGSRADNGTCVLWQCAPEMLGRAEAEEAEGHQEDQHIHRHVCGLLQPLCYYKVSRDLGVKDLRASWKYRYKQFYWANSSNVTKTAFFINNSAFISLWLLIRLYLYSTEYRLE